MNVAGHMRRTFELMNIHHAAWLKVRHDPDLTEAERDEHYNTYTDATAAAFEALQQVREHETLVLSSIAEAKAFLGMWPNLMDNRGALQHVRVTNVNKDGQKLIRRWLEESHFNVQNAELVFNLPP